MPGWLEKTKRRYPRGHRVTICIARQEKGADQNLPYLACITSRYDDAPETGSYICACAILRPVPEAAQPGGFNCSRKALFSGLGAVGSPLAPAKTRNDAPQPPWDIRLFTRINHIRHVIERRIHAALLRDTAAVTTALITGDRGAIPEETLHALHDPGLAHLLAISGMHKALMAGALYWLLRILTAAIPPIALRFAIKKWAAVLATFGGAF